MAVSTSLKGHVEKRGKNSYRITITLGKLPDGKPDRIRETFVGTEQEAVARKEQIIQEILRGKYSGTVSKARTMKDLFDEWLAVRRVGREPKTIEQYKFLGEEYIIPAFGNRLVTDITLRDIEQQYANWQTSERPLSATSIWHIHTVLSGMFRYAQKHNIIENNPCQKIESLPKKPDHSVTKEDYWTISEVHKFLAAAQGEQYRMYFVLVLGTGMRVNEARALRWKNVDLVGKKILVCEAIKQEENKKKGIKRIIGKPKTAAGYRWVAISDELVEELMKHKIEQEKLKAEIGSAYIDNDLVIANGFGDYVNKGQLIKVMNRIIERANSINKDDPIKRIPLRNLRHTHACALLTLGVDMKTIQQRLGHTNYAFTANVYAHAAEVLEMDAAVRSGAIIRTPKKIRYSRANPIPNLIPNGVPVL